jgi:hypothetical protein
VIVVGSGRLESGLSAWRRRRDAIFGPAPDRLLARAAARAVRMVSSPAVKLPVWVNPRELTKGIYIRPRNLLPAKAEDFFIK